MAEDLGYTEQKRGNLVSKIETQHTSCQWLVAIFVCDQSELGRLCLTCLTVSTLGGIRAGSRCDGSGIRRACSDTPSPRHSPARTAPRQSRTRLYLKTMI